MHWKATQQASRAAPGSGSFRNVLEGSGKAVWFRLWFHVKRYVRMTSMRITQLMIAVALFIAGCHEMQPSPVASSATAPPAPISQPGPPRAPAAFSVNLGANGGIAYLHEPWSATLSVTSTDPSAGLPASVGLRCGDDPEQVFSGFIGLRIVSCTFQQAGTYPVTAAVVAPSGLLTSTSITLLANPRPTIAFYLDVSWRRVNAISAPHPEYEFTVTPSDVSESLSEIHWNFADEGGEDTDATRRARHIYMEPSPQTKVVTVTARTGSHGIVAGSTTIKF